MTLDRTADDTGTHHDTRHNSGVSLIIAVIFVSFFMLLLANFAEVQLAVIRNAGNFRNEIRVESLVDSTEEVAALLAAKHFAGWNSTPQDTAAYDQMLWESARAMGFDACGPQGATTTPCAGFSVQGRSSDSTKIHFSDNSGDRFYYSVPTPFRDGNKLVGTGSAAKADSQGLAACDPVTYKDGTQANDPCFWDKLKVGQTVEIPLYYEDDNGVVENLDLSTSTFKLRVRTPCDNDKYEEVVGVARCQRVELFPRVSVTPDPYRNVKKDQVLIQWMITGEDKTLLANDANLSGIRDERFKDNTELSAGRINDGLSGADGRYLSDFLVLQEDYTGIQLAGTVETLNVLIKDFNPGNSTLRLSLVGQPRRNVYDSTQYNPERHANNRDFDIPYLEYQLLVICNTSGCAPSDSKAILSGWVETRDFRRNFVKYRRREPSFGGFVLENF